MRSIVLSVLALLLGSVPGHAQQVAYSQYGVSEGMPTNAVSEVVRDRSGFAWIATDQGLVRYDGQQFATVWRPAAAPGEMVLEARPAGGIWFAAAAGVFAAVPEDDTIAVRPLARTEADTSATPTELVQGARGTLWLSRSDGSMAQVRDGQLRSASLGTDSATGGVQLAEDEQERLWAATPTGTLYRYARAANRFVSVADLGLDDLRVLRVRQDTLWAAGDGLVRAHVTADGAVTDVRRGAAEGRVLTALAIGSEGLFLGSAADGLFRGRLGPEGLTLQPVYGANDPHRMVPLPFQNVHHLLADRDGTIWVSSDQGLGLLQVPFFQVPSALPEYTTFAIHPEDAGVALSVGDAFRVKVGDPSTPTIRPGSVPIDPSVTAVASTGDTLWLGTADGRVLTVAAGQTRRVRDLSGQGEAVFYLHDDRRGYVWACQAPAGTPLKGVTRLSPSGARTFYDADDGLQNRVLSVREGPDGTLYTAGIGAETYLHRYVPAEDRFVNLSRPLPFDPGPTFEAHDLAVGPDGTLWLATTAGLLRHGTAQTRRVDLGAYTTDEIRSVEVMPNGDVWLATATHGLLHYRDGTTVQVGQDRGLISTQMMYRTLRADGQGRLWVGTTVEGAVYSRNRTPVPDSTPTPRLLAARGSERTLGTRVPLTLNAQEDLTLRYGALAFPATGQVKYQYRVRGVGDSSWSDASTDPTLRLHRISARMRAIEVRARAGSGHYWSDVLRVPLTVRPVWYRRWWAYLLFGLGAVGVGAVLVWLSYERQKAQAALREREARLRGIANSIPGVVFQAVGTSDGTYEASFVSEPAEALLGLSPEPEGFYERFVARIPASHREAFQASIEEAFENGTPWRHELPFETPSGETLWLLGASMPEQREESLVYNGVILDITERKERERVLKEEQEALQSMYRITADPQAAFDDKVRRLLDLGREHLDLPYGFLARISDDTHKIAYARGTHSRLEKGAECALSASYCRRTVQDERLLTVQDAAADGWADDPAYEAFGFGAYVGAPVVVEDDLYGTYCFAGAEAKAESFTERERTFVELMAQWVSYELERRRAQARLEHQNERLDSFASLVTHDLRNPLNVAMGRLELARDEAAGDGETDHLASVERALGRIDEIIDDVLALTWSGQTIDPEDLQDCDLAQLSRACWDHVDTTDSTLEVRAAPIVRADEGRLRRLLENLFRNAVEHGGSSVTVRVGGHDDGFFVADDGPGIPPDERTAVLREGYSSGEEGTGLGLAIVQSIAEVHGWALSVTESEAGGARFEVTGVETTAEVSESD